MKAISDLADKIECTLREAEEYIDCAIYKKEENPSLADLYYKLSEQRMKDQTLLHDQVVILITNYKKSNDETPEHMQFLYNYLHKKFENWAMRIKVKQSMF